MELLPKQRPPINSPLACWEDADMNEVHSISSLNGSSLSRDLISELSERNPTSSHLHDLSSMMVNPLPPTPTSSMLKTPSSRCSPLSMERLKSTNRIPSSTCLVADEKPLFADIVSHALHAPAIQKLSTFSKKFFGPSQHNSCIYYKSRKQGKKLFQCSWCQSRFGIQGHLSRHIRSHTGERPFECSACKKRFARRSHLVRHLRTHTGEKPFQCNSCSKSFSRTDSLARHLRIHVKA